MTLTKVTSSVIADNAITTAKIENGTIVNADINSSAAIAQSKLGLSIPTITGVTIQNGVGAIIPSDTSLYFDIAGTNFTNPSTVELLDNSTNAATQATTVTYVSATALRVTASLAAGTYKIRVTRSDGLSGNSATALLTVSQAVAFSTAAGSLGTVNQNVAISTITIAATSDSAITFAVQSGSLPGGLSLNASNGQITGTPSTVSADTTSTFTIRATDAESQSADREFTITVTKVVITKSLRFNNDDSAYLSRTPSGAGNRKTWTISAWVKRGSVFDSSGVSADADQSILGSAAGAVNYSHLMFTHDQMQFYDINSGTYVFRFKTNAEFRDPAAWYHVVVSCDTTQATESNRFKWYINGEQITSWANEVYPSQNADTLIHSTNLHTVGRYADSSSGFYDGYMAEYHLIDGTAYAASTFGQTDSDGAWIPKAYTGSHGTNGFYLDFADTGNFGDDESANTNDLTATNFAAIDQTTDTPQTNFATMNPLGTNNIATFSEGLTKLTTGDGASIAGANIAMTSGKWYAEFTCTAKSSVNMNVGIVRADTFDGDSQMDEGDNVGYMYQNNGNIFHGGANESYGASWAVDDIIGIAFDADTLNVQFYKNGTGQGNYTRIASENSGGDWIMCVGEGQGSGLTATFECNFGNPPSTISSSNADANGHGNFEYAVPSGYLALCTDNLPEPSIKDPSAHFHTQLYTGNGVDDRSITNDANAGNFKPDFLWIKQRDTTRGHNLVDSVRGATKYLGSHTTSAENTNANGVQAFETDGFQLGTDTDINQNTGTYVAWQWKAGGSAPTNTYTVKVVSDSGNKYRFDDYGTSAITLELQEGGTYTFDQSDSSNSGHPLRFSTTADGTHGSGTEYTTGVTTTGTPGSAGAKTVITVAGSAATLYYYCSVHSGMGGQANTGSLFGFTNVKGATQCVVSPNTTAGFSVITHAGTGGDTTIGHGLSAAPKAVIFKSRDGGLVSWAVYHDALGTTGRLVLNSTASVTTSSSYWNSTAPSTTVISLGSSDEANKSSNTYVAYAFAEIEGYSKIGSYTGNGNADGAFVYTGFRPAWVMYKNSSSASNWIIRDNKRTTSGGTNPNGTILLPNSTNAESTNDSATVIDLLSNGFKIRNTENNDNTSGNNYIFMAFAESPFGGILTNEVTAR